MKPTSSMMEKGILYVATGEKYIHEASKSARSVRRHNSDIPIAIITDFGGDIPSVFNKVIQKNSIESHWGSASLYLKQTPFRKTIYLDTDTYINSDVSDVYDLLNQFDVALSHAPFRRAPESTFEAEGFQYPVDGLPKSFPEYNRGVFGYIKNYNTNKFLSYYNDIFNEYLEETGVTHDQPALRKALFESDIRIATLPPEYNCRIPFPGYLQGNVKIIHGRCDDIQSIEQRLNSSTAPRVHYWKNELRDKLELKTAKSENTMTNLRLLQSSIRKNGLTNTIKKVFKYIMNS